MSRAPVLLLLSLVLMPLLKESVSPGATALHVSKEGR